MSGSALHRLRTTVRPWVPRRLHAAANRGVGRVAALALTGNNVSCPCCGARLRRFVAYPSMYCPRCGSYERHRALALVLEQRPELLAPPLRLLQVSPDRPLERFVAREGIERTSIDRDNPTVDLQMDVEDLAFADESFDAVLALAVLDVVADRTRALGELRRVLRPGGLGVFQVGLADQPAVVDDLADCGLEVETIRSSSLGEAAVRKHGLIADEETYVCRKPS